MADTVWLLDVDGVINARKPGWGAAPFSSTVFDGMCNFKIQWAPALIQRMRALIDTGLVEIRWSSTWCGDTWRIEQALHLPPLTDAFTTPPSRYVGDAKLEAARKVLADGQRLIWTDDDEVPDDGPLRDELTASGRSLLIRPDSRCGLQPADMDAIEAFVGLREAVGNG